MTGEVIEDMVETVKNEDLIVEEATLEGTILEERILEETTVIVVSSIYFSISKDVHYSTTTS